MKGYRSDTIWAAAIPGGGRQLNTSQSWIINLKPNIPQQGQIWARTNCSFSKSGHGTCDSGDCNGQLQCKSNGKYILFAFVIEIPIYTEDISNSDKVCRPPTCFKPWWSFSFEFGWRTN
ncbi:hypothetical protein AQUCO_02300209v1 [Aquilegia coerulea]|uniref:Thaumatin-like protein n=1 Tax=Aquilegia coerulea TaxID=218851 RepID=A0A2G5DCU4_AQUCA|nr:hypothetical protein AQUCO_02300209v1 [Aquilegia coerulea]